MAWDDIMTAEPEVKSAGANIQASTISTIVLGFAADPMARWVWPDSSEYLRIMPQFVNAFGGRAFEHGTAYITEGARAALERRRLMLRFRSFRTRSNRLRPASFLLSYLQENQAKSHKQESGRCPTNRSAQQQSPDEQHPTQNTH